MESMRISNETDEMLIEIKRMRFEETYGNCKRDMRSEA
jgi:hypothetical protein